MNYRGESLASVARMASTHREGNGISPRTATSLVLLGAGAALLTYGTTRRITNGRWYGSDDTRVALGGERGIHVREAIRLERPIGDVYAFWRRLENLPRFMRHVESVTEDGTRSRWVATGPGGTHVRWEAELINDEPDKVIAWRSMPHSDVTTAGSVNFARVRDGSATQLTVNLQYAVPAGKTGAAIAMLFGREPSQMIREDLRRLKQLLETGEIARATAAETGTNV